MAVFCIPKHIASKLKEAATNGEINIKLLYEMNSKQRNEFWQKYVNQEIAQFINAGFEKAVLDEQQASLETWVKNTFSIKDKVRKKNVIDRIGELSQSGALNPDNSENFLSDLVAEKLGITITAEEAQKIDEMSRGLQEEFTKVPDQFGLPSTEYFEQREAMNKYLKSLVPSSNLKIFTSIIGRGSMLFSIKSPLTNIIGNSIQQVESRLEKRISSGNYSGKVDKSVMKAYVKRVNEIYKASGFDVTRVNSYSEGAKILGEDIVHSEGKGKIRRIGRFYEDVVFKQLMSAPDVWFSSITFADTANLMATKLAKEEGLTGDALSKRATEIFRDATSVTPQTVQGEFLREQAISDSLVATFQDETAYSKLSLGIRKLLNDASGDLRFGDQLIKFAKTPANVTGFTLDAGGLGLVKGFWQLPTAIKEIKDGNPELMAKVVKNFTRAGLGMTIAFIIAAAFDPEDFIGRWPTNPSEQELLNTKKAKENSVRIGNKWVSLDYLGFLGGPLIGFLYAKKYGTDLLTSASSYVAGVALQSIKTPGLEQFYDLYKGIADIKPEGGLGITDILKSGRSWTLDQLRAMVIPAFVADLAKAFDDTERQTDPLKLTDKFKANIPGFRNTLQEKKDVFGAVIKGEPWWSVMLFGTRMQTARDDKIISEITRLSESGNIPTLTRPEKNPTSRMAQLKTQIGEEKYKDANSYFRKKYLNGVTKLMNTNSYKRMSDEDKKKEIDKIRQDSMDSTLRKFNYNKSKKTSEIRPTESKPISFNFKLVKEAYAAEEITDLKNKLTWSKDERGKVERFLDNVSKNIFGEREWNQPKEAIQAEKLNSAQKKEYYDTMWLIRQNDPDWYYQNLGEKAEKRILGFSADEKLVREAIKRGEWTANEERPVEKTVSVPTEVQKEVAKATPTGFEPKTTDEVEPAPTVGSSKGTDTPYNDIIKKVFGDGWKDATKILKRTDKDGKIVGENVQLLSGPEVDIPNRTIYDPVLKKRVWNNAPDAPIDKVADPFDKTGKRMIDSIDRGLFRINNETFLTYLRSKEDRPKMFEAGIIDELHPEWDGLTQEVRNKYWDYMLDPEKNIKMAKLIMDKQGEAAWFASKEYIK